MKIGLVTIYTVPNYGSVLQAFATQQTLENMGHECKIVDYKYPNEWHYRHGFTKPDRIRAMLRNLGLKPAHRKDIYLNQFRKKKYNYTRRYASLSELENETWNGFDAFVVGSDQVWNSRYLIGDKAFLLSFVPRDIPRYSIASSFALRQLPQKYECLYKSELSKFSALSVREKNGVDIIQKQLNINKDVIVCLDPTLLLTRDQWLNYIARSGFRKKRPYILLYMLTYAFEPRPYIFEVLRYYKEKMDCDIIALEGYCNLKQSQGVEMTCAEDSSVTKFIDLFNNADLVVTSSFHGTAFAVNFGRPLISIVPDDNGDDRQTTLLTSVGADQCVVHIGQAVDSINPYYNVENVLKKLSRLRTDCLEWIKCNIID